MAWLYVILAGIFEMLGVTMMNQFHKSKSAASLLALFAAFAISFFLLSLGLKTLPMGTAYAIWTGIGAAGGALIGMLFYGEARSITRMVCLSLIITAVIGLKLVTA
ncbi:multidrug efflux SMR transporter [Alkalihalobacillus oceani]|uniref:Multidrug efflux SMR transporter n=1 Tax=Halalkalibacter oceani TaxID=1653776 RepID=A0A9X2DTT5_9BACI|nr:multidrug efflux SMR transporter [Halalkalibacter oceani]MCM3715405.1 multidrug efflux SMR transporter [Halalkalibacter oceani]